MTDTQTENKLVKPPWHARWLWRILGGAVVVLVLLVGSFELVYAGKVYPGVTADGIYLSGLSKTGAATQLGTSTASYQHATIPLTYGKSTQQIPVSALAVNYDAAGGAAAAYSYGRTGSVLNRAQQQVRALLDRPTNFAVYTYDDTKLAPYLDQASAAVSTPVIDATLTYTNNRASVVPATNGQRLNLGRLILSLEDRLSATSHDAISAPVYSLAPQVTTASLTAALPLATTDLAAPLTLSYATTKVTVDQATIAKWIKVAATTPGNFSDTHDIHDLYPQTVADTSLSVDQSAITSYLATMSATVNQDPVNAQLAMVNGVLTVTKPSQQGVALDTSSALKSIMTALADGNTSRTVTIPAKTTQADVREDNLASLGITDQLSEGETYFPGSGPSRLINVRTGAAHFNGVLLAPGQQFSFGALLGEVDASTGYVPGLVILADHEELQYGGGLCQVSSTAFRAALAAGLPINERINHAFAISFYTWPYTAPGVDATIYYPSVDFKFTNDTGHYLLMQTTMSGVDLKFDFYGTKTKSGVIRGPYFVSGSNDPTKPSQTVFYRDVLDLAGNVVKTDTFNTYYKSSLDYPVE